MDCNMEELLEVLVGDAEAIGHALRQYCRASAAMVFGSFGAQGEREVDRREKPQEVGLQVLEVGYNNIK